MTTVKRLAKPEPPQPPPHIQLPDPDPWDLDVTTYEQVLIHGYPAALIHHLGNPETTIIISEIGASLRPTMRYEDVRFPDLLIAFDVDPEARRASNGYIVSEQGKPPDFVLEVASARTGRNDETVKRDYYQAMGVGEYWRFDPSGGRWHSTALAGDALVNGAYESIPTPEGADGVVSGYSAALRLELHWVDGNLRLWDPVSGRYLETHLEVIAARSAAEARAAAAEGHAAAAEAHIAVAEAHATAAQAHAAAAIEEARQLREQLNRLQSPE